MTTARTTRGEGTRYRVDRPTFADIMRDQRSRCGTAKKITGATWEPVTGFPTSACRQLTLAPTLRSHA